MIYGILLVYYEQYHARSVIEFQYLLNHLNQKNKLIVVSNNPLISQSNSNYVLGDDLSSEFSGYDVGLKQIENLTTEDYIIFANDTFCHHRAWGKFEKKIFINKFQTAIKTQKKSIVGELNTFGKNFSIMGLQANEWISTYLFGMTSHFIEDLNQRLCIDPVSLIELVSIDAYENFQWSGKLSNNLKTQLSSWLASNNKLGWYDKDANMQRRCNKAKSILNEFYLSAIAKKYGYELIDVYQNLNLLDRAIIFFKRLVRHIKLRYGF